MKRQEFLDALKERLNRLPSEELENALDYYNEIFLDAGEENEEQTAESLGSIDNIARQIYNENGIDPDGSPTYILENLPEAGRRERRNNGEEPILEDSVYTKFMKKRAAQRSAGGNPAADYQQQEDYGCSEDYRTSPDYREPASSGISPVKLIVLILLSPIIFAFFVTFLCLSLVFTLLGVILEVVFVAAGAGLLVGGIVYAFSVPPVGVMAIGAGLILLGLFGLTIKHCFKGCFKAASGMFNGLIGGMHRIFFGGEVNG